MGLRAAVLNAKEYGKLCSVVVPKLISNDSEFDRMVEQLEALTFKKNSSPEEDALAQLLTKLIQDYDAAHHPLPDVPPQKMIAFLMEQRGLRQADMLPVFGSRSVASDVLNGKREPSKAHIRKLAAFFKVSPELFL